MNLSKTNKAPFNREWLHCQQVYMEYLVEQDDLRNIVTFLDVIDQHDIDLVFDLPYTTEEVESEYSLWLAERNNRVKGKTKSKKNKPKSLDAPKDRREDEKRAFSMINMFPDLHNNEEF